MFTLQMEKREAQRTMYLRLHLAVRRRKDSAKVTQASPCVLTGRPSRQALQWAQQTYGDNELLSGAAEPTKCLHMRVRKSPLERRGNQDLEPLATLPKVSQPVGWVSNPGLWPQNGTLLPLYVTIPWPSSQDSPEGWEGSCTSSRTRDEACAQPLRQGRGGSTSSAAPR